MIVLASRSSVRVKLLRDAGVSFDAMAADLDEDAIMAGIAKPAEQAATLARMKALHISKSRRGVYVVGGDQVGVLDDGTNLEKPKDKAHHVELLLAMAGRKHTFHPAVALVKDDVVVAEAADAVTVTFRKFSRETAQRYVDSGEGSGSCGGYEIEHKGAQLVERVDGSLQAVLGFPLLLLLPLLRAHCPTEAGLL